MPIPELERHKVERALTAFCDRVPLHGRSQLAYEYRFRGNAVTLLESRAHYVDASKRTVCAIAKFAYSPTVGAWSLKWLDRNERWHTYQGFERVPQFRDLLREVETDPTGIFFG